MSSGEEDYYEGYGSGDEERFEDEFGAFERAGGGVGAGHLREIVGGKFEKIQKRMKHVYASEEEKFKEAVNVCLMKYKDYFGYEDYEKIFSSIDRVPDIRYKNPCAYIFGYYVKRGNKIDKGNFTKITRLIKNEEIEGITPPDVIRYARFWIQNDI